MSRVFWAALLAAVGGACASFGTSELAIPDRKVPESFAGAASGPSPAETSWREWFGDPRLNGLITEALRNNQDLQIALQRIQISRAAVRGATGALLPQVALSLGSSVQKYGLYTSEGAGNASTEITPGRLVPVPETNFGVALQASWEVDLWGRLRAQRESAIAQHLASIEGTNLVLTSLIADVASAYFELLAFDQVHEVLEQSVARQQQALEVVQLQKEAGRANALAVQQFEAQLAQTRALEREAVREVAEAENRINLLLGRYPQPLARDRQQLLAESAARLRAGVPAQLLTNRPDIREAELQLQATRFDVKAARAAFLPSLNLSAGAGFEAFKPSFLLRIPQSLTHSVVGGLLAPLVNRRALEAQFAGASASQIQAMYHYQRTILTAYAEVVNALSSIRRADEILTLKKSQKAALAQSIATADMLYRAGKASYLEVLLAQQNALQADLDLVDILKRRRIADVVLYRALGGGWR
jgi:NodT family efflux transporter outer membrane factor (OMF) lipoprotein